MVKRVPLTTELSQELNVGSPVQFSGGTVEPMKNKMPSAISKQSAAMLQLQKASQALADQLNDAEATRLYNEFQPELENNHNAYLELKGFDAVRSIPPEEEGGKVTHVLDTYKNTNLKNLQETYLKKASNGSVRFMFKAKSDEAIKDSQAKMTRHSVIEQKKGATDALKEHLLITTRETIDDYKNWDKDGSVYQTRKYVGMALLDEIAMVNGWNIDPTKGRISSNYLTLRSEYLHSVAQGVIKKMKEDEVDPAIRKKYIDTVYGDLGEKVADKELELAKNEGKLHKLTDCVEATLRDNGNTNDGSYVSSANKLYCLSSSNSFDDGKGASVTNGLHDDEIDTNEKSIAENMEMTEQILGTSKFYSPDSKLNGSLINQHKTTHMFAALHLGVEKADSLYTKAKSQVDIDPKQFKNNPVYAKNINSKIITNYKKLIIEEATKKYQPEIVRLKNEIKKLEDKPDLYKPRVGGIISGPLPGSEAYKNEKIDLEKKKKIKQLKNQLVLANLEDPKFVDKIVADLNILEKEIDYDYDPQITAELKIDKVSGLQPLSVLEEKLRATILDPEELKVALKDLRIKHNDITNSSNELYNQRFQEATIIATARENGHIDLAKNGIQISDFREEDQQKLINGQPKESDSKTLVMLNDNPQELKDNLNKYSYKMNKTDLLKLRDFADGLDTPDKVLAVTLENDMLKLEIERAGFSDIINNNDGDSKQAKEQRNNYLELVDEWRRLIDQEQRTSGQQLGRERKRELLQLILNDKVFTGEKKNWWGGKVEQPQITLQIDPKDTAYVTVYGESVLLSSVPKFMRDIIRERLRSRNKSYSEVDIVKRWVDIGRPAIDNKSDWEKYIIEWEKNKFKNNNNNNNAKEISESNQKPYMPYFNLPI